MYVFLFTMLIQVLFVTGILLVRHGIKQIRTGETLRVGKNSRTQFGGWQIGFEKGKKVKIEGWVNLIIGIIMSVGFGYLSFRFVYVHIPSLFNN